MKLSQYLDATYLKTALQANISEEETIKKVISLVKEAIHYNFKLVMIRAEYIDIAKKMIQEAKSNVLIGTVIGFHEGTASVDEKIDAAQKAIDVGADELDFVINYSAFKKGNLKLIEEEVKRGTQLCLENEKKVKWIVEVAALTNEEIVVISQRIRDTVIDNFGVENAKNVFVKSSTGFYKTENNKPNGATIESMKIILENAKPLRVKAAGGVKNYQAAKTMIKMGVDRIGTSSAKQIVEKESTIETDY